MRRKEQREKILNVPNGLTFVRMVGVSVESVLYAKSGKLNHFLGAGAFFLLDVLDGPAARKLKQQTQFGEQFDPIVDKLSIAALASTAFMRHEVDWPVAAVVGALNISNIAATTVAKARNVPVAVTKLGKYSQFGMNVGLGLHVIGKNLVNSSEDPHVRAAGQALRVFGGTAATLVTLSLGIQATEVYWDQAIHGMPPEEPPTNTTDALIPATV